jgi:hypothetical protein
MEFKIQGSRQTKSTQLPHPGQDKHLCYLTNMHFHQSNWPETKIWSKAHQSSAKLCGRSAGRQKPDCAGPVKLDRSPATLKAGYH